MNEAMFPDLLESVREGGVLLRGEAEQPQRHEMSAIGVKKIRDDYGMSQSEFSALLGISIKTLQNWEQGRRTPYGAARVLLQVAAKHPRAVWDVVEPTMPK